MRPPGQPQGARHRPSRGGTAERAREGVGPNGMPSGTDRLTDGLGRLTGEPVDLHGRGVWDSSRARSLMLEEGETNVYQFCFFGVTHVHGNMVHLKMISVRKWKTAPVSGSYAPC